jgi:hypothetical protein
MDVLIGWKGGGGGGGVGEIVWFLTCAFFEILILGKFFTLI